jgi:hypothetical protein
MSLPPPQVIKLLASQHGYIERRQEASSTLFFKNAQQQLNPTLINVFYTTGGIMTKLSHPRSGYNELWRSDAYDSVEMLRDIFADPRLHTGQGYRRASCAKRGCVKCGQQKTKGDYSKNQWRKGPGSAKCSDCVGQHREEPSKGEDIVGNEHGIQPSDITWNTINDAITCDAEGCNKTSPTIRCNCAGPVYYCSETCKRRHRREHREDCIDLEHFRRLAMASDPNVNSGLCNASPSTKSQQAGYARATQLVGKRTIEALLLQAEYIHQEEQDWEKAIELYHQVFMLGGDDGENLNPSQCRMTFMGLGRCHYEIGDYDKAIYGMKASLDMNRGFPHIHKYLALSHKARGNYDLAIKTMKEAVLYEAPWSDETIRLNKELLCELINEHSVTDATTEKGRIDVFYGRADGTIGYKEYTAVVVRTTETNKLEYYDDLYEPRSGCDYEILFEVPMSYLPMLCGQAGVDKPNVVGWITSPLKEVILKYWEKKKKNSGSNETQMIHGISLLSIGS